jgi:hypothetical protein
VLKPPWLRPSASVLASPFSPSGMLVGADDGAIDEMHIPIELTSGIGLLLQGLKQMLEDPSLPTAVEAARHRPLKEGIS